MSKLAWAGPVWFAWAALLLFGQAASALAEEYGSGAAAGSFRAAQEEGLDLTLPFDPVEGEDPSAATDDVPGGSGAAEDGPDRVDWSRRVGEDWELNPVLLNRRQAGQPDRPDDDLSNKLLGIELRKEF